MSNTSIIKNNQEAYNIVNNYFNNDLKITTISNSQIHAIAKAAFDVLMKSVQTEENFESGLIKTIKSILISHDTPWKPTLKPESKVERLFFTLLRGNIPEMGELSDPTLIRSFFWKHDPDLTKECRQFLNKIFEEIYSDITTKPLKNKEEAFHLEIIIGDLLALYPYLNPSREEVLKVPLMIGNEWKLVDYKVEKIPLTPKWMGSPLVAYGLHPQSDAPPLLLFKGTTYPADSGFSLSILTDINPFASVGSYAFKLARNKIHDLLIKQSRSGKYKTIIYGKSLGGAQSWRTALKFPDLVSKVMAYGAPGFSDRDLARIDTLSKENRLPEINIFCQDNDPVPLVDEAAMQGVNYYLVVPENKQQGVLAHAHISSAHEKSTILRLTSFAKIDTWKRTALTCLRTVISIIVFPILLAIHLTFYAITQSAKYIAKQLHGMGFKKNINPLSSELPE